MPRFPQRSDLYWIPLEVAEDGDKQRPMVIVSRDDLNRGHSVVAMPCYSQQLDKRSKLPYCVFLKAGEGGLDKNCVVKADEIDAIEKLELDVQRGASFSSLVSSNKMESVA